MVARLLRFVGLLGALVAMLAAGQAATASLRPVYVIRVSGTIDSINAQYLQRALQQAQHDGAELLLLEINTPGGLDSSMRAMFQAMLTSPVPTVAYVAPAGARAASAGVFIVMAANVAAMAPGTNIGAAHPVSAGGPMDQVMAEKVTNDAAATLRAIAEQRGRNAEWAEQAVRESKSITATEALELKVIDLIAADRQELLHKLDGRTVTTAAGERTLSTRDAPVRELPMTPAEAILHRLIDPTIAYILLTIGAYALLAELFNPGQILPGIVGALCLILAFVALEQLPLNWGGLALLALAIVLFVLEIKITSHGLLTLGGVIAFVLGSLMLFAPLTPPDVRAPVMRVSPWVIATMTLATVGFFSYLVGAGLRAQRAGPVMGPHALIGAIGVAETDLNPTGSVLVHSESWSAIAEPRSKLDAPIKKGERVRVKAVEGLRLRVERA